MAILAVRENAGQGCDTLPPTDGVLFKMFAFFLCVTYQLSVSFLKFTDHDQ